MSKGWASPGGKWPACANVAHTYGARGAQAPREEGAMSGSAGRLGEPPCQAGAQAIHRNTPPAQATSPTASQIPPRATLMPRTTETIIDHLAPQCHCWGLFIPTGAGDAVGKPQPWAREMKDGEEEKGARQHRADPSHGGVTGSCRLCLARVTHPIQAGILWSIPVGLGAGAGGLSGLGSPPYVAAPLTHPLPLCQPGRAAHGTSAKTGGGCPAGWMPPWPAGSTWPPSSPGGGNLVASARGTRATGH